MEAVTDELAGGGDAGAPPDEGGADLLSERPGRHRREPAVRGRNAAVVEAHGRRAARADGEGAQGIAGSADGVVQSAGPRHQPAGRGRRLPAAQRACQRRLGARAAARTAGAARTRGARDAGGRRLQAARDAGGDRGGPRRRLRQRHHDVAGPAADQDRRPQGSDRPAAHVRDDAGVSRGVRPQRPGSIAGAEGNRSGAGAGR